MRASGAGVRALPPGEGNEGTVTNTNSNNNNNNNINRNSSRNTENSGSQYAMCALGVGLVALGVVMIVWSVVPADGARRDGGTEDGGGGGGGGGGRPENRSKVSSVAFVLVGSGVVMLLLSLCLGLRNKRREQLGLQEAQAHREAGVAGREQDGGETAEEREQRFAVPSYEEAVGSGQYPVRQSNLQHSSTQLPSYDDLVQVDGVRYENEGSEVTPVDSQPATADSSAPNRRPGKTTRKLLPIKIRRIKSEKLRMKNVDGPNSTPGLSIEPLTPPPQYDDKVPPI